MTDTATDTATADQPFRRVVFAFGGAAGVIAVGANRGFSPSTFGVIAGFLGLGAGASWAAWRLRRQAWTGPIGANEKQSRNLVLAAGTIGGVFGLLLAIGGIEADDMTYMFGDGPISPALGALFLAVWFIAVPVISWLWWRVIDEHEARSYSFGGMAALNVYYFVTPGWWIGWKAGFVPEPQHMAIYLVVTAVWLVGWMWRRYR